MRRFTIPSEFHYPLIGWADALIKQMGIDAFKEAVERGEIKSPNRLEREAAEEYIKTGSKK